MLGTATLSGGVANFTANLAAGSHTLTATYPGDPRYAASATTAPAVVTVSVASTVVTVSGSPASVPLGSATTLTASIAPAAATGRITFTDTITGLTLGSATISGGKASIGATFSPAAAHTVTATYSGDANDAASTSAVATISVTPGATAVTLANTPASPVTYGSSVTLSTTMTTILNVNPTGTVQYFDGATSLGSAPVTLNSGNVPVSKFTFATLMPGVHSLTAVYSGDGNYGTATSAPVSFTVTQSNSTTTLVATPPQTVPGQSFTLTATAASVSGTGTPTGTVTFFDQNNVNLGTVALAGGTASITQSKTPLGSYSYTASYSGDTDFTASSSAATPTVVLVKQLASSTTVTANPTSGTFGSGTYSVTATVVPASGGPATGSVTFTDGKTVLGTITLGSTDIAVLSNVTLAGGTHSIVATYSGDPIYTLSASATPAVITVATAASATGLTVTPATSAFGTSVTFSAAVTSSTSTPATGTINFMSGGTLLGTGTLNGSATVSFTTSTLPIAVYNVTAVYSGDTNFSASTSAPTTVTVNQIPQTITLSSIPVSVTYGAAPITITTSASSGLTVALSVTGPATLNGSVLTINGAGTVTVTATQAGNTTYAAANPIVSTITVARAPLTVTTANQTIPYGAAIPILIGTVTGVVNGDNITATYATTATVSSNPGTYPITATLVDPNNRLANYTVTNAGATLTISASAQTITFPAISTSVTYGVAPIALAATSTSHLAVVYTVTGPAAIVGSTLTITGAGTVVVTATQPGNAIYSAATSVPQTVTVAKAALTVTVNNQSSNVGATIPTLTGTLTGVVNNDAITATYATTGTSSSPAGTYPITATLVDPNGRLVNYTVTNTPGVLTLSINAQTITFPAPPATVTYGVAPIPLGATASSSLAVAYSVTGPATVTGSTLTITGAGTVVVTASQAGNGTYSAATPVARTITVSPAALTVTVANQTMLAGAAVPTLTGTLTGVVNSDAITATYATTGTSSSPAGTYPITATLVDPNSRLANYTVTNTPGTLTISLNTQTITFPALTASVVYGTAPATLAATASSKLAVTYSVTGPATISGSTLTYTGAGTVVVTASQAGNTTYSAATPVVQTITVAKAPLTVVVNSLSSVAGSAIPTLTGTLTGVVNGDNISATYSTTATSSSPAGSYPITATVVDPGSKLGNYAVTNTPGTLTLVAPVALSLSPTSLSLAAGGSGTSTLTVAPGGGFTGSVTLGCSSPVSYVTCTVTSPVTISGTSSGTATVSIGVAATYGMLSAPHMGPRPAGAAFAVLLPFGALLLVPVVRRRKTMLKNRSLQLLALLLMAAGMSLAVTGCGGGSSTVAPSLPPIGAQTVTITATANGTPTTATLTVNVTN